MAATGSTAELTTPSMLELDSSRSTGQVPDNIGDKPNQPVLYNFGNLAKQSQYLGVCSQHGFENGHGCIMTKRRIRSFVTLVA